MSDEHITCERCHGEFQETLGQPDGYAFGITKWPYETLAAAEKCVASYDLCHTCYWAFINWLKT